MTATTISVQVGARCPFAIAHEYVTDYLRRAEARGREAAIRAPLTPFGGWLGRRVGLRFGLRLDDSEAGRPQEEVRLTWRSGSRWLPDFQGTIRFRIAEPQGTTILVEGAYQPPLGRFGRLFDRVIGCRVARASLRDLARRLAVEVEQRETQWRRAHPAPVGESTPV